MRREEFGVIVFMAQDQLIYGVHAVAAALRRSAPRLTGICIVEGNPRNARLQAVIAQAARHGITVRYETRAVLDKWAGEGVHQGIVAWRRPAAPLHEHDLIDLVQGLDEPALLLALDGVQDPHNLGACLRSADAAGVHAVIAPRDRAVGLNATVSKVASGAAENLPFVQVTNLARSLRALKEAGVWVVGATGEAELSLYDADLTGPIVLVMGAEGAGLRRLTQELCDYRVHIPMRGGVESLNVSVATGVCLFEALRQRLASEVR